VTAEVAIYLKELLWVLDQITEILATYPVGRLDWRPSTSAANSGYAIANHVLQVTRVYALGFGCGQVVTRNRSVEFTADGGDSRELITKLRELAHDLETALGALPAETLDRRLRPSPDLWGTGEPREISAREAIVESIRHAAIHLGELRLTRDLAVRGDRPGG